MKLNRWVLQERYTRARPEGKWILSETFQFKRDAIEKMRSHLRLYWKNVEYRVVERIVERKRIIGYKLIHPEMWP